MSLCLCGSKDWDRAGPKPEPDNSPQRHKGTKEEKIDRDRREAFLVLKAGSQPDFPSVDRPLCLCAFVVQRIGIGQDQSESRTISPQRHKGPGNRAQLPAHQNLGALNLRQKVVLNHKDTEANRRIASWPRSVRERFSSLNRAPATTRRTPVLSTGTLKLTSRPSDRRSSLR